MSRNQQEIRDDEFRVLGGAKGKGAMFPLWLKILIPVVLAFIAVCLLFIFRKHEGAEPQDGVFEQETVQQDITQTIELKPFGVETAESFTEKIDTVINDIPLTLYIPHNAEPQLVVGRPDVKDSQIILAAQAADIRRDNKKILGAFVLKGEPLAWGLSKKGYCAIIEGNMTIGYSENSPLFEEATETGGYFFRQYPLVSEGVLVENELKNKSIRKGLCSRAGEIFITVTQTSESLHDFSQALVDLGVENAIYLVGSDLAYGFYSDSTSTRTLFNHNPVPFRYKNENYVVWRKI